MGITKKPHAVLLASPGLGHLIPMVELAKRLALRHGFYITVFAVPMEPNTNPIDPQLLSLSTAPTHHFDIILLPHVNNTNFIHPSANIMTRIAIMMRGYIPLLRSMIASLDDHPTLLVVDLFGTEVMKIICNEFDTTVKKYVYIASNAWFLAETIYVPLLDHNKSIVKNEPLNLPGCRALPYDDILEPVLDDPKSYNYWEYIRIGVEMGLADGVLVNTWEDLEPVSVKALRENKELNAKFNKPVYPVGPLFRPAKSDSNLLETGLSEWLDQQPIESVIYISFGSGGTLSSQQTLELAHGLELSQQRFIWVFRPPIEHDAAGSLFNSADGHDDQSILSNCLPKGFLKRTSEIGKIIPMWASQAEILAHESVGGFLTHCGWNSSLESIVNGVPIFAWPLYAEQNMNATMLVEDIGVAVRSKELPNKGIVGRWEIEKLVREVMVENDAIRLRVKELQKSAQMSLRFDGSSGKSLSQVANDCSELRFGSGLMEQNAQRGMV